MPRSCAPTTVDLTVDHLGPGQPAFVIDPVDPLCARMLDDGSLLAPIIGSDESSRRHTSGV